MEAVFSRSFWFWQITLSRRVSGCWRRASSLSGEFLWLLCFLALGQLTRLSSVVPNSHLNNRLEKSFPLCRMVWDLEILGGGKWEGEWVAAGDRPGVRGCPVLVGDRCSKGSLLQVTWRRISILTGLKVFQWGKSSPRHMGWASWKSKPIENFTHCQDNIILLGVDFCLAASVCQMIDNWPFISIRHYCAII